MSFRNKERRGHSSKDASRFAARVLLVFVFGMFFLYLQTAALQYWHDSCRYWNEPPPWSSFCPPSTKHGRIHA